jgi:hypothetical protein
MVRCSGSYSVLNQAPVHIAAFWFHDPIPQRWGRSGVPGQSTFSYGTTRYAPHKSSGHPSGTSKSRKLATRDGYGMSKGQNDAKWRPFKNTAMLIEGRFYLWPTPLAANIPFLCCKVVSNLIKGSLLLLSSLPQLPILVVHLVLVTWMHCGTATTRNAAMIVARYPK